MSQKSKQDPSLAVNKVIYRGEEGTFNKNDLVTWFG